MCIHGSCEAFILEFLDLFLEGLPGGGKFRGVLVGVIAEEFCGVEMAVHGAGVAAVFREDEGALLCPHPQGPEIVMYAFHIAAALVEPAAGMIHEAAGVCEVDFFRQAQGIELGTLSAVRK